jgi:hypothetical protein
MWLSLSWSTKLSQSGDIPRSTNVCAAVEPQNRQQNLWIVWCETVCGWKEIMIGRSKKTDRQGDLFVEDVGVA